MSILIAVVSLPALFVLPPPAPALAQRGAAEPSDPPPRIRQRQHTRWLEPEGAPSGVTGLAQTRDGFLWLAAAGGLYRFDGLRFEHMVAQPSATRAAALFVARNGDLWIANRANGGFAIYRNGRLSPVPSPFSLTGTVTLFAQTTDGAIWAGLPENGQPLYRYFEGRWTRIEQPPYRPDDGLTGLAATADGALWLSYMNSVMRIPPGSLVGERILDAPGAFGVVNRDREGRVWFIDKTTARPISGPGGQGPYLRGANFSVPRAGRPRDSIFDQSGALWMAGTNGEVNRLDTSAPSDRQPQVEAFGRVDGLSSIGVNALIEDREGNIWVGSARGLDRFRRAAITLETRLTSPAAYGDLLTVGADGSVYVAQADAVYRIRPLGWPERLTSLPSEPESLCEALDGTIWVATAETIIGLKGGARHVLPRPQVAAGELYDCLADRPGLWLIGAGSKGLFQLDGGLWRLERLDASGPPVETMMLARDDAGDVWASNGDSLARLREGRWSQPAALPAGDAIQSFFPTAEGLLLAGPRGVSRHTTDGLTLLSDETLLRGANGILQTPTGEIWLFPSAGIIRLLPGELDRAHREHRPARFRVFDSGDGLPDRGPNQSWRALVQGGDGRIWAATLAGTVWIDPSKVVANTLAPPVAITALKLDGTTYRDPIELRLPAGGNDVSIRFSALSLTIPERVQVRYKLNGHDPDWIDPDQRREAFYTNLKPGRYRFQVIAANEDGIWNRQGATLAFVIPPTFLQSIWFKLLCGLVLLALGSAAYALRIRELTTRMRARFQVRVAERERIARELHDTLLQGFQALVLQFQAVANRISPEGELRASVDQALDRADAVLVEGRARVRELRSDTETGDLPSDLAAAAREIGESEGIGVDVRVEGVVRELQALVGEELLRIAEEAVRNAARHSKSDRVEILLVYGAHVLSLAVEDRGVGLPESVRTAGAPEGHYGLVGMQERALRIGGRFTLSGAEREGTRLAVTLPAASAYSDNRWTDWLPRLPRMLRGS